MSAKRVQKWREKTKARAVESMGGSCALCGYNKCSWSLTFHHLDPSTKKFNIAFAHSRSWSTIVEELRKCVLLCHNCHNEVHAGITNINASCPKFDESYATGTPVGGNPGPKNVSLTHGTKTAYCYHKCRCDICKNANSSRAKEYRRVVRDKILAG